ncbi:hypothetical protein AB0M47_42490 [Hamadaea sp. NPDC051192]|uniref:hypothetical protein n=1 Tax=Hamadaea sp. NPDC051192 TaxID=3154940 RepID=UPI003421FA51
MLGSVALLVAAALVALSIESSGTPAASARGTGHDAEWLGHAWVDGRKSQSDVDDLVAWLRTTGIRDLFVHSGPFNDDGTLDPAVRPRGRWFVDAIHQALPGVRVQAWLGAHPVPGELDFALASTQANLSTSAAQVLDDGFDGVHYDFEPVVDGDPDLLTVLRQAHEVTRARGAVLSVSAVHTEPWRGMTVGLAMVPTSLALWSAGYLRQVALEVDQVALMAYDTSLPSQAAYAGYVRRVTEAALQAVPEEVALFIGIPAYHDEHPFHHRQAETVAAAVRGVRLAMGDTALTREFGVAAYVDFAATAEDWAAYREGWHD